MAPTPPSKVTDRVKFAWFIKECIAYMESGYSRAKFNLNSHEREAIEQWFDGGRQGADSLVAEMVLKYGKEEE